MPYAMGRPVLCHAHRDEAIECHRRREHEGGTCIVVCRLSLDLVCLLDEGEQNAFCPAIHERTLPDAGEVLLYDVDEAIGDTTRYLVVG